MITGSLKLSVGVASSSDLLEIEGHLLKDLVPVGQSARRSVGFSEWTVVIGRTRFDTIPSVLDPTLFKWNTVAQIVTSRDSTEMLTDR